MKSNLEKKLNKIIEDKINTSNPSNLKTYPLKNEINYDIIASTWLYHNQQNNPLNLEFIDEIKDNYMQYKFWKNEFKKIEILGSLIGIFKLFKLNNNNDILCFICLPNEKPNVIKVNSDVLTTIMNNMIYQTSNENSIAVITWRIN